MSYFKLKYKENKESLKNIISDKEINELFLKHEDDLKTKKKSNMKFTGNIHEETQKLLEMF